MLLSERKAKAGRWLTVSEEFSATTLFPNISIMIVARETVKPTLSLPLSD
jgi:hypothetical protein